MTQSIIIQVGQCGNQIGCRFWDLVLREHASINKKGIYDEALGSFFINIGDTSNTNKLKGSKLKARAVLIDMEEGVVSEIMRGPMKELFDYQQLVTDVSGSGNNWAVGHYEYAQKYSNKIGDVIRKAVEACAHLQCFFVLHSMGGGTGSGLGTFILNLLENEYPDVYRFVVPVFPSDDDDVITSPYNTVLALQQLTNHADCVLPLENQALLKIHSKILQSLPQDKPGKRTYNSSHQRINMGSALSDGDGSKISESSGKKPFDSMNNIVANLLLNLTCSSRFEGDLNVDLNEITTNLVPFPSMHYLMASQSPLYSLTDLNLTSRRLDNMFGDAFSSDSQLIKGDPKQGMYLACALIVRGTVEISDVRKNIDRLKPGLKFVPWNTDGWKVGMCSVPPFAHPYSLLALANNSCIWKNFSQLKDGFVKLYNRKAHLHHYMKIDGMESYHFEESLESITCLMESYRSIEESSSGARIPRIRVIP